MSAFDIVKCAKTITKTILSVNAPSRDSMLKTLRAIAESYLFILLVSLAVGLFLPEAKALVPWNTFILQAIFFLSSLKIDVRAVVRDLSDWRVVLAANAVMLVVLPFAVRLLLEPLFPSVSFSLFLLAAMPIGMTTPLLVEVMGGKQTLALVLTVVSSLLAPVTIPIMTRLAYGASVSVDAFSMFRSLALVIFVPFLLAELVKRSAPRIIVRVNPRTKPVSIALLGLLIAGAVANQSEAIREAVRTGWAETLLLVAGLYAFFVALHVVGYWSIWWKPREVRRTVAVCLVYMNFTLAIFLANRFFPRPEVVLPLVLSILPWATLLPAWKKISARLH